MTDAINHAERDHALLSASGASKWLNCPPSARLEDRFEQEESSFAKEGTLAHEIAELKLQQVLGKKLHGRTYNTKLKKLRENELYQAEMNGYTDAYVDYIQAIVHGYTLAPQVLIEQKVDFSHIAPEGFGTLDCAVMGYDETLHIIDLKYGKGVSVSANENKQLKLYAAGIIKAYELFMPFTKITLHVVQPRLKNFSAFEMSTDQLNQDLSEYKQKADLAFHGAGEFCAGEHCLFCKAKAPCKERGNEFLKLELVKEKHELGLIEDSEIGEILKKASGLKSWIDSLKKYALKKALQGVKIEGFKLVRGKTSRDYVSLENAYEMVKLNGVDEALLYERKPLSVSQLEKVIGKDLYSQLEENGLIIKKAGNPTLAEETDARKELTQPTANDDFGAAI